MSDTDTPSHTHTHNIIYKKITHLARGPVEGAVAHGDEGHEEEVLHVVGEVPGVAVAHLAQALVPPVMVVVVMMILLFL